jgi:recombination protein RecR
MSGSPSVDALMEALRILPGVGPKTAQRMAFHLVERNRAGAARLAERIGQALERVRRCESCRNLADEPVCALCQDPRRADAPLCVVESPADVAAIESAHGHRGRYFVLHGHLSPIDGIGPEVLGLDALFARVAREGVREVIIATNPTVEGEATAHYIATGLQTAGVTLSRIAHGVPLGGELEYLDGATLTRALAGRRPL